MGFYCHCQICQQFNNKPYADVVVYYAKDVEVPDQQDIAYRYFSKPPMVKRGSCIACNNPVLEYLELPLLPKFAIVPRANAVNLEALPAAEMHMFYHRRVSDSQDPLPKYNGYLKSMVMVMYHLFRAMWSNRKSA